VGGYPRIDSDVMKIGQNNCTAVLDLQTEHQQSMREVNLNQLKRTFINRVNITNVINHPVEDLFIEEYVD